MNDTLQTLIRSVLKVGAGVLVTKGITDQSGAEILVASVVGIVGVVWGILHKKSDAGTPVAK